MKPFSTCCALLLLCLGMAAEQSATSTRVAVRGIEPHHVFRSFPLRFQSKPAPGDPEQQDLPATWLSFTVVDASSGTLTLRQISKDGKELDHFIVTKK